LVHLCVLLRFPLCPYTTLFRSVLALVAIRLARRPAAGRYTYGYKRAEILSAQANGVTLLLLAAFFVYEGIHRLIEPPDVAGPLVLITAVARSEEHTSELQSRENLVC